ncbi:MAG: TCR/Tet family MFS transporter [Candidatus Pacebacteria bacterium]|nr:TCR/Tet family MFS transporter [Candidatus Paceibacterota bacterium]
MKNKALVILALVMLVNALSYGTIIPLLYPYASRFGINPLGLSFLFASFSLFQFLATPIIGALSDKYGRKPLLLLSLLGTSLSLAFFASAHAVWQLFLARILDGITGGNMSVAQAVIADSVEGKQRAKAFGLLGASFGFGFLIGPALGGFLSGYGLTVPFWFASGLALLGTVLGYFFLEETNPKHKRTHLSSDIKFIDPVSLINALKMPVVGVLILIVLITSLAGNAFIIGFQSFTVDVLKLGPKQIGLLFTLSGLVSVLMQAGGIKLLDKLTSSKKKLLIVLFAASALALLALTFASTLPLFVAVMVFYMIPNSASAPVLQGLISENSPEHSQGKTLGISSSFMSLGQIVGPIVAGIVAHFYVPGIFTFSSVLMVVALIIVIKKIVAD